MKNKMNYIDHIPEISSSIKWKVRDDNLVELIQQNTGICNKLAQVIFKKPQVSFIKLDIYGSCIWQEIDGKKTIYDIGQILKEKHESAGRQLYERIATYFEVLKRNKYVIFVNDRQE